MATLPTRAAGSPFRGLPVLLQPERIWGLATGIQQSFPRFFFDLCASAHIAPRNTLIFLCKNIINPLSLKPGRRNMEDYDPMAFRRASEDVLAAWALCALLFAALFIGSLINSVPDLDRQNASVAAKCFHDFVRPDDLRKRAPLHANGSANRWIENVSQGPKRFRSARISERHRTKFLKQPTIIGSVDGRPNLP